MNILEDKEFLDFVSHQESQFITSAADFRDITKASFDEEDENAGLKLPWPGLSDKFAMRGGELTVWAGINGHGKSQVLNQVCGLTMEATRWLIASLEMPVQKTMNRLMRQMSGLAHPSDAYIDALLDTTENHLWIYDQLDSVKHDRIIAMVHYAASKLGIQHIIIDSLMKCGLAFDDSNGQKEFIDRLCWAAKTHNIHIHLVAHMKKGEKESKVPDKFDVKGVGEIIDMADNLIIFHRNKDKERRRDAGEQVGEGEPDNALIVAKQRHGTGWEGMLPLYHHAPSKQYLSSPKAPPFQVNANTDFRVRA
jgi:twinkle protein